MPYFMFAGAEYYPIGGAADFVGTYESIQAAKDAMVEPSDGRPRWDWAHIADENLSIVSTFVAYAWDDSTSGPRMFWKDSQ